MVTPIPRLLASIRNMVHEDLSLVSDIERRSYDYPWSHGVFRDCLLAGYTCIVIERDGDVCGYAILSVAAGEAHVLNLCVDPTIRSLGYGEQLLDALIGRARDADVDQVFLEVRPSNTTAIRLYNKKGFHKIADRRGYYQASDGREDASVLAKKLRPY
ncbi:MAG: ribosomal protein S18-alanine N-acetyltransferase [Pseudomonadota bacterium]